jgi:hypothetical protein
VEAGALHERESLARVGLGEAGALAAFQGDISEGYRQAVERDEAGRFVLDGMESPDGTIRLLAFRDNGAIRIGVAKGSGPILADIAVRGGSIDYEPYAWRARGWAVAFGGVPPGAVRAEVRNDDGEVYPARILPIPEELATEDRAAWGLIDRWEDECPLVCFDEAGDHLTTIGEFAVRPRTFIGEGDDPIGGRWRLWISHLQFGPMLNVRSAWGRSGCGIGQLPAFGFACIGRGHRAVPEPQRWDTDGLVSSRAERVEVTTPVGTRPAIVLTVPSHEFGPCKAYVAFLEGEEVPLSLTAFDEDGEAFATFDFAS